MKLGHWLKKEKLTFGAFGQRIKRSHSTVQRYVTGERFPSREAMRDVYVTTFGEVTPNDFCDLPPLEKVRREVADVDAPEMLGA